MMLTLQLVPRRGEVLSINIQGNAPSFIHIYIAIVEFIVNPLVWILLLPHCLLKKWRCCL